MIYHALWLRLETFRALAGRITNQCCARMSVLAVEGSITREGQNFEFNLFTAEGRKP